MYKLTKELAICLNKCRSEFIVYCQQREGLDKEDLKHEDKVKGKINFPWVTNF